MRVDQLTGVVVPGYPLLLRFAIAAVIALSATIPAIPANEPPPANDDRLLRYAGSYETDQFLADPRVADPLRRVAGGDLAHLQHNLDVRGSIDLVSGWLTIAGNAPHAGTAEEAVVCIHPDGGSAHAAILSDGVITVMTTVDDYVSLPLCVKDWITLVNSRHVDRLTRPMNTRIVNP